MVHLYMALSELVELGMLKINLIFYLKSVGIWIFRSYICCCIYIDIVQWGDSDLYI